MVRTNKKMSYDSKQTQMYSRVFHNNVGLNGSDANDGSCMCPSNSFSVSRQDDSVCLERWNICHSPKELDAEKARQVATTKGWMFDPRTRLQQ
mmetsp:Transcript_41924/g.47340  ORF Transcript_41924/g.47340 Transcript_41924/m.47340 type:complete len:93 (+) Transcript_41924:1379-1657(+)